MRSIDPEEAWERLVRHHLGDALPEVERRKLAAAVREARRMPGSEGDVDIAAEREAARRRREAGVH